MTDSHWDRLDDRDAFIKVSDLNVGQEGSFSDYEELAFSDTDCKVYELTRKIVAEMVYCSSVNDDKHYSTNGMDPGQFCDVIFYNVAHIMMWWTANTQHIMTEDMIRLAVETSWYMVNTTLNTGWLSRSGYDWAEEYRKVKDERVAPVPDHIPDEIKAYWYEPARERDPEDKWGTDELELTYKRVSSRVTATFGSEFED